MSHPAEEVVLGVVSEKPRGISSTRSTKPVSRK